MRADAPRNGSHARRWPSRDGWWRRAVLAIPVVGVVLALAGGCHSTEEVKAPPGFDPVQVAEFSRIFRGLPVQPKTGALSDFGHLHQSTSHYFEALPNSATEARSIMERAVAGKVAIRVRGRGHSTHGGSLPAARELLLKTENLRTYSFDAPGTITVESGVSMYGLHLFLQERGFILPVYNDGGFGPSLGGYISASGFGIHSTDHGGFWENVESVDLVDGRGQHLVLFRDHPDFRWLFGSMGQLGLVLRARLKILPQSPDTAYPQGETGMVPLVGNEQWGHEMDRPVFWLTIFTPTKDKEEVQAVLDRFLRGADVLDYNPEGGTISDLGAYTYVIKFREFTPPLMNPHAGDLIAHGVWGFLKKSATEADFFAFERSFHELVTSRPGWTRYIQSEALPPSFDFRAYWGESVYAHFLSLKQKYDPLGLVNGTRVFPASAVANDR